MLLFEEYRPKSWPDVVGQDKALARIETLRKRGLGGRAFWIAGQSGTGKTTIARLLAAEMADGFSTEEIDASDCTPARLKDIERSMRTKALGKGGRAYIVNEAHGLRKDAIRQLLVMLERLPAHVVFIFTTTNDGQDSLIEDQIFCRPAWAACSSVRRSEGVRSSSQRIFCAISSGRHRSSSERWSSCRSSSCFVCAVMSPSLPKSCGIEDGLV